MATAGFSDLPTEALDQIARRVGPLDNFGCSAVCRPWSCALKTARLRRLARPNLPHYVCVEPRYKCSGWESRFGQQKQAWNNKVYLRRRNCQDLIGVTMDGKKESAHPTRVIGCNYGWVVTVDNARSLTLLEPPTGRQFPLPRLTTSIGRSKKVHKNVNRMGQDMFRKAALAPGRRLGTFALMLIHSGGYGLSFLAPGAGCWSALRSPAWTPKKYLDVAFHKGAFYTVSVDSELNAWEPDGSATGLRARLVASPRTAPVWAVLVESATRDELLMVSTPLDGPGLYSGMSAEVSRYDERNGGWIPEVNRGEITILAKENSALCVSRRGGEPALSTRTWSSHVKFSSDSPVSDGSLILDDGCWFLPYVGPVFPQK